MYGMGPRDKQHMQIKGNKANRDGDKNCFFN